MSGEGPDGALVIQYVALDGLRANDYNPNVMDQATMLKAIESIHRFGFVDPVVARSMAYPCDIIDGEHRWRIAHQHSAACRLDPDTKEWDHVGMREIPVVFLKVDDGDAEQLTIVLNELRGKPDRERMTLLVQRLAQRRSVGELEKVLPFRRQQLASMISERRDAVDWEHMERPKATVEGETKERWVERVYRMPKSAAEVVDNAIDKVREDGVNDDWKALELICADYLGGA